MDNNIEIGEKYLPIGTVVMLKGGSKRAMITGFCSISSEDKTKVYDYSGCIFPEGYLSSNQVCLFDHNQIEKVYFKGLVDDEEKQFKLKLKAISDSFDPSMLEDYDDDDEVGEIEVEDLQMVPETEELENL